MAIGVVAVLVSAFLVLITPVARHPVVFILGGLLCPIGIGLCIYALASGWKTAFGNPAKHPIERAAGVYIVAKIMLDDNKDQVYNMDAHEPTELEFFVQININGKTREFVTPFEVFEQVGEGMNGDIVYQGRWLSQFIFKPRLSGDDQVDPFLPSRRT